MKTFASLLLVLAALAVTPVAASAATPSCDGVRATMVGTPGDDHLVGTSSRDVIVGLEGDDTLEGRDGDDLLCGGAGADRLEGGPGRDWLFGERDAVNDSTGERCAHGDALDGGAGADRLDPGYDSRRGALGCGPLDEVRFRQGEGGVTVDLEAGTARGQGRDSIVVGQALSVVGSDGDDELRGTGRSEEFDPRQGKDVVVAGNGRDQVIEGFGHNGNDDYDLGDGRDTIITRSGFDGIRTGTDDDVIMAFNPQRVGIDAGHGADEVTRYFAPDQERVSGGEGPDQLAVHLDDGPADPADLDIPSGYLTVDGRTVVVDGFEHWIFVSQRSITVTGSDQPETVEAYGRGNDEAVLTASMGAGDDQVYADAGDDTVDGGEGTDYADLGEGTDTCTAVEDGPC